MDVPALLFLGARIFRRAFYFTVLQICSETRIFCRSKLQNINLIITRHIITKHMDQPWDYLASYWSFLLLSLTFLGILLLQQRMVDDDRLFF